MTMSRSEKERIREVRKAIAKGESGTHLPTRRERRTIRTRYDRMLSGMCRRPPRKLLQRLRRIEQRYPNAKKRWLQMSPKRYAEYERMLQRLEVYR